MWTAGRMNRWRVLRPDVGRMARGAGPLHPGHRSRQVHRTICAHHPSAVSAVQDGDNGHRSQSEDVSRTAHPDRAVHVLRLLLQPLPATPRTGCAPRTRCRTEPTALVPSPRFLPCELGHVALVLRSVAEKREALRARHRSHRVPTLEFDTGTDSTRNYTRAKVIDMVFFVEGGEGSVA